jgi:hypothetical protein
MSDINEILKTAYKKAEFEDGSPFTQMGFDQLKKEVSLFVFQLVDNSYRIAKTKKNDLISTEDVKEASSQLNKNRKKANQLISSIGGFLLGFSLTRVFELLGDGSEISFRNLMIIFPTGIVGAFFLGIILFGKRD